MKIKVLVADPISEKGIEILNSKADFSVDVKTKLPEAEIVKIISEYDALIVRSETKVTPAIIDAASKLKIIGRAGVGVDNVDIPAATKKGIIVMNTPGGNTISAAEHTVSMMLALSRNIPQANASLKNGAWDRKKFTGTEVKGKVLGVIGLGKIGAEVAKRAKAFGMEILAYDPLATAEHAEKIGATLTTLDEIYKKSDYITLHIPKTKDTENLICKDTIAKMKDGVRIINVARGGIVNEQDLADAAKSGKVKGAALDVFITEPCTDSPTFGVDNIIVTPHLGASTEEAQINVAIDIVEQIVTFFEKDIIQNAVNVPSMDTELMKELHPFIVLAEKIGSLQTQLLDDGIKEAEIRYAGEIANKDVSSLTISFLKGLFSSFEEEINFVNAPFIAKERGIKIKESKVSKLEDFLNLITVTVKNDKGDKLVISGTLFYNEDIRIIAINDFSIDMVPNGYILVSHHNDVPGIIGQVGTILGQSEINIAGMQVGRKKTGGEAIMVTNVDQSISQDVLDKIASVKDVTKVKMIKL